MLNKLQIIGHLGGDAEIKYMQSGDAVTNFSVATSERWKDKQTGEQKEVTEWHRCVAFGKLAEICGEYLVKGQLVYCEGKLRTNKYTDKDGIERYSTQVILDVMRMLGGKRDENNGEKRERPQQNSRPAQNSRPTQSAPNSGNYEDDDIPF